MTQYAVVAFPETDALEAIETVRRRFDPQAGMIPAHITIVFPFESGLSSPALHSHVASALSGVPSLQIHLAGVRVSDGEYIYLEVQEGCERVSELHKLLYTGPLARHLSREHPYEPHVTLGRLSDHRMLVAACDSAAALVPPSEAHISELAVFRLDGLSSGSVDFTVRFDAQA